MQLLDSCLIKFERGFFLFKIQLGISVFLSGDGRQRIDIFNNLQNKQLLQTLPLIVFKLELHVYLVYWNSLF